MTVARQIQPSRHASAANRPPVSAKLLAALGLGTTALVAAAVFNRAKAADAERRMPPMGRFIEVDGVRLHYVERGRGRPVVLLHGNGAMIQDMIVSGVLFPAAEKYRVIAFDRPGFGYSERPRTRVWTAQAQAELIHRALDAMGVERPIVVGHSWGTLVALALALDFPRSVEGLVLISGYFFPGFRADAVTSLIPALPIVGDLMTQTVSPLLARALGPAMIGKLFAPARVPKKFAAFPTELAMRPSQVRAVAADTELMVPAAASLSPRYTRLRLPVTVITGDGDRIVDMHEQSERLHAAIPGSRLIIIPEAGHMVHHMVPEEVIGAIDAMVRLTSPGPAETQPV